jgi:hypothetical protein
MESDLGFSGEGRRGRRLGTGENLPSDPRYQEVLKHLGGLKPGDDKLVPPWPD